MKIPLQLTTLLAVILAHTPLALAEAPKEPTVEDRGAWLVITSYDAYNWQQPIAQNTPTVRILRKDKILSVVASFDGFQEEAVKSDGDPATAPTVITITTTELNGAPVNNNTVTQNMRYIVRGMTWTQAQKAVAKVLGALQSPDEGRPER